MINYNILADSQEFYKNLEYTYIEVPWTVTREVSEITVGKEKLKEYNLVHKNNKMLLGSGEQAFLYQITKGYIPYGKYQTITPCFRFENQDVFHQKYFMKNELIEFSEEPLTQSDLLKTINKCLTFYMKHVKNQLLLTIVNTSSSNGISYDINLEDIELGSYGIRNYKGIHWIYATGVAEPRFSKALKYHGIS